MLVVKATIRGDTPYSPSRMVQSEKETSEKDDAFDLRTWRERIHADAEGNVFIPPMAIKNCLCDVSRFISEPVPGKGKATYTKHFDAGVLVCQPVLIGIKKDEVQSERVFVPSNGRKGGGNRVWKTFPIIPQWQGTAEIILLDPTLIAKPQKVKQYLEHAGKFIGLGRFRPRNGGYYGRFTLMKFM